MYNSLYDIQIQHAALVEELIDSEGDLSPELEMALSINEDELESKAEAYALRILEFDGQADAVDKEIKRLQKRKQSFEKTGERLKEIIKAAMFQFKKEKIKTDKVTLSFRKSEIVEVPETWAEEILCFVTLKAEIDFETLQKDIEDADYNQSLMPLKPTEEILKYFKLSATVDKAKMKVALKEGVTIDDNIMLITKQNIQIK